MPDWVVSVGGMRSTAAGCLFHGNWTKRLGADTVLKEKGVVPNENIAAGWFAGPERGALA